MAIFSVTPGPLAARVQYDLRRILGQLWAHAAAPRGLHRQRPCQVQDGLTDEGDAQFLADLLAGFKPWVERMQVALASE